MTFEDALCKLMDDPSGVIAREEDLGRTVELNEDDTLKVTGGPLTAYEIVLEDWEWYPF